jgi:hypothetical protein
MPCFNGTVSRYLDELLVVWMDRAFFGDESLIFLNLSVASWLLTLNFTFFRGVEKRLHLYMLLGQPSCKYVKVFGNPLTNMLKDIKGYDNPLKNSSESITNITNFWT